MNLMHRILGFLGFRVPGSDVILSILFCVNFLEEMNREIQRF